MKIVNIIGGLIIFLFFALLFIGMVKESGLSMALKVFLSTAGTVLVLGLGVYLLTV